MYNSASVKGSMDKLPERLGTAVISGDIIGIYIGGGNVIYAKSAADGVVTEKKRILIMKFSLMNMTKPRKTILDLYNGQSRHTKTAGDMCTEHTEMC